MALKEPKISKKAAAGTKRDITFTIPDTLEIVWKPGNATSQNVIMAAYKIWIVDYAWYKETQEKNYM
jgi:hypothetical protein